MVLPFLTTTDRLRLSESSQGLVLYRNHLSHIKLRHHPSVMTTASGGGSSSGGGTSTTTTAMLHGALMRLLSNQSTAFGLHIRDKSVLALIIDWLRSSPFSSSSSSSNDGITTSIALLSHHHDHRNTFPPSSTIPRSMCGWRRLTQLHLSHTHLTESDGQVLGLVLAGGYCRWLTELSVGFHYDTTPSCVSHVMQALSHNGACPHLSHLHIHYPNARGSAVGHEVALALQSSYFHHLRHLDLKGTRVGDDGIITMAQALSTTTVPRLTGLNLHVCGFGAPGAVAVGERLRYGACR